MSRCPLLSALALCVAVHSARADCNFPAAVRTAAVFPNQAIDLSTGSTTRLPYAKDFRLQVQPAAKLSALTVFYSLDKSTAGPRSGLVVAVTNDGCVWNAPMPRLHVSETGVFRLDLFTPASPVGGARPLSALLLDELSTIPSGLDPVAYRAAAAARAQTALAATYPPGLRLVIRAPDGSFRPMDELLAESFARDLDFDNAVNDILRRFRVVAERGQDIIDRQGATPTISSCPSGTSVAATVQLANDIRKGGAAEVLARIGDRRLPLPDCAVTLFQDVAAANAATAAKGSADLALAEITALHALPALAQLSAIVARIEALQQLSVSVATIDVPVGGDLLERYTQTDVMTVVLPGPSHLVQPFATAALYMFQNWSMKPELTASVEPRDWRSGDRLALQFGYPAGGTLHAPDVPFDPQYLLGAQYRLNSVLSVSSGAVVGKESGIQRGRWYFGTNLDISNLGPFQQLFARRDQP